MWIKTIAVSKIYTIINISVLRAQRSGAGHSTVNMKPDALITTNSTNLRHPNEYVGAPETYDTRGSAD